MRLLTQLCRSGGCAAKLDISNLRRILDFVEIDDTLVSAAIRRGEDVGLTELDNGLILVQSTDAIAPVSNDPQVYGGIAAAHALSDLYAKGIAPRAATIFIGFPPGELPVEEAGMIIQGAARKLKEANCILLGGHSFVASDVILGLTVSGVGALPIVANSPAHPGDHLLLTKSIGVGLVVSGTKMQSEGLDTAIPDLEFYQTQAERQMLELNSWTVSGPVIPMQGVNAATDVSGFGLVGHLFELLGENSAELTFTSIPICSGARELVEVGITSVAMDTNVAEWVGRCSFESQAARQYWPILFDPQTSGGLLLAVSSEHLADLLTHMKDHQVAVTEIGRVLANKPGKISLWVC